MKNLRSTRLALATVASITALSVNLAHANDAQAQTALTEDAAFFEAPPKGRNLCGKWISHAELMKKINAIRAKGATCGSRKYAPAPALKWNNQLFNASRFHSNDMAKNNYFDHTGADGSMPWDRAKKFGYASSYVGENIAAGYPTVDQTLKQWMGSVGHCQNIMSKNYKDYGLACVKGGEWGYLWTQMFGAK